MTDVSEQSVADVLNRAAVLIEPEGAWIQGYVGRDADGNPVTAEGIDRAVCFCMAGAIWRAAGPFDEVYPMVHGKLFPLVNRAARQANGIGPWNDDPSRTQAEVVAALRSAALLAAPRAGEG